MAPPPRRTAGRPSKRDGNSKRRTDGLLPPFDADEVGWTFGPVQEDADPGAGIDRLARSVQALLETRQPGWPARVDGELWTPPDGHVLDHLVRDHLLDGAEEALDARWQMHVLMRPQAGTVVLVDQAPACSLCAIKFPASYDTPWDVSPDGPRTFFCDNHFRLRGAERLGLGFAQWLITPRKLSPGVRASYLAAESFWVARGVPEPTSLPWD